MSTPVNLNKARKKKARVDRKARADQNAVLHGLPKSARVSARNLTDLGEKRLDQHKMPKGNA